LAVCSNKVLQAAAWFFIATFTTEFSPAAFEQSISLARAAQAEPGPGADFGAVGDCDFILAASLEDYAIALIERGEITRATPLITEYMAIYQRWGIRYEMACASASFGRIALLQGDLAQAHKLLREAIAIAADFNLQEMLGSWQTLLGIVTLYQGDRVEAQRLLSEGLRIYLVLNAPWLTARVCTYLAELALWEGELAQAESWLGQSLAYYADARRLTIYEVERCWIAARLATAQQQYQRAAMLFGLAEQMHGQFHYAIAGPIRFLADEALATVQATLEPIVFADSFAMGQQMTLAQAFATILALTV